MNSPKEHLFNKDILKNYWEKIFTMLEKIKLFERNFFYKDANSKK